jgi:transcriptional regulator with PAS, ATPase and Fis domain
VNCAAIPENLLESEIFGYVKGAFTGAERDKTGRFQEANEGTIFLDEIGDLPLALQAKLLRVLEDKEFYRLGSRHTIKVDVRIISATNRNLAKLVEKRLFREDLYYRLNVFRIALPELKDRKVDLPILIGHILRRLSAARGVRLPEVSEKVMEILLNYTYPGNVRELENILEHALIICQNETIKLRHLPEYLQVLTSTHKSQPPRSIEHIDVTEKKECDKIIAMLERYNWHRSKTAMALGMDRSTLWRKIKKYGIVN